MTETATYRKLYLYIISKFLTKYILVLVIYPSFTYWGHSIEPEDLVLIKIAYSSWGAKILYLVEFVT